MLALEVWLFRYGQEEGEAGVMKMLLSIGRADVVPAVCGWSLGVYTGSSSPE